MRVIQSKFTKTNKLFFFKAGGSPDAPVLDPPLLVKMHDFFK